jgi:hypothetical protein
MTRTPPVIPGIVSADEAEASPVALRAPSDAPASCGFPLDMTRSPSCRRLSKEFVAREKVGRSTDFECDSRRLRQPGLDGGGEVH